MNLESILTILKKIIDICLVWVVFYYVLKNIRKNVKFSMLFKGIVIIILIKLLADYLGLVTIGLLFEYLITWGPIAIIIVFQPEIRNVLEQLGRTQLLGRHKTLTVTERERLVSEIGIAIDYLRKNKIGALIVIERDTSLSEYIEKAKKLYAEISNELLCAIFFPDNPLHDGGVIIQGDKITCAGAVFPTTVDMKFSKRLGTRHRAAIGISEESDCIAIVVSEETGRVSVAIGGKLNYNLSVDEVKLLILDELIRGIYKFFDRKILLPITKFFVAIGKKLKISEKPFEAALTTKSSMIIISLLFSLAAFFIVDAKSTTLLETNAEVIYNRPVTATYNDEEYIIEGLPETVDITLIGTKANLYLAKQLPTQDVTVDLSDLKPGVHKVNLKYKQSISNVEYKLDPSVVTVVVSPKKSETKSLTSEIVNLSKLDSKLSIESTKIDADDVIVKGTEESLAKVASVKALINVSNMSDPKVGENKLKEVPLVAYDENGKIMDVEVVPSTVTATIQISSPSKEVPIKVVPTGTVVFGKAISTLTPSVERVTIYGDTKTLEKTDSITVKVDVSDLKSDKQVTKTIKKPNGIREMSVKTINVDIKLDDEVTTEISGVKLGYINLGENYVVQATDTSSTEVTVILKGVKSVVSTITPASVEAYVDLKDLTEGEHEVEVKIKGLDSRVQYTSKVTNATIKITQK